MDIQPREMVILADDFEALVAWYRDVLGFQVTKQFDEKYHYANLETASGIKLGIASAEEMGVTPGDRNRNTVVFQFAVENVKDFFAHVAANAGRATFGPAFNEKDEFWYGGIADPEGNPCWVVDMKCP